MMCSRCRAGNVVVVYETAEHTKSGITVTFADEFSRCEACGEEFYTHEQSQAHSRALTAALREKTGAFSGERVHRARKALGMTQEQFERALGVGKKTVGRWERGSVPPSGIAGVALMLAELHPDVFRQIAAARGLGVEAPRTAACVVGKISAAPSENLPAPAVRLKEDKVFALTSQTGSGPRFRVFESPKEPVQV